MLYGIFFLKTDIQRYFDENIGNTPNIITYQTEAERNHGREEYREYYISYDISSITNKEKWDTVSSIGMVRVYRKIRDRLEINDHYYIMDTQIAIGIFVKATRNHWNIECGLHWRLDVILNEDHSRNRVKNSIANLSAVRKLVFNLVRLDTSFGKISFEKKLTHYRLDFTTIENLIFNVLPYVVRLDRPT